MRMQFQRNDTLNISLGTMQASISSIILIQYISCKDSYRGISTESASFQFLKHIHSDHAGIYIYSVYSLCDVKLNECKVSSRQKHPQTAPHVGRLFCHSIRKLYMRDRSKIIVYACMITVTNARVRI